MEVDEAGFDEDEALFEAGGGAVCSESEWCGVGFAGEVCGVDAEGLRDFLERRVVGHGFAGFPADPLAVGDAGAVGGVFLR